MKPSSLLCSCALAVMMSLQPSWADQELILNNDIPDVYTVKKGDTLWDISNHFLATPWLWPKLWQANPEIKNPHLIYPGDKLYLVWIDGQPRLQRKPMKVVKLSPSIKVTRSPITTLHSSLVMPYLVEHRLLSEQAINDAPQILGSSDQRQKLSEGDLVWADSELPIGEEWWVYRPLESFKQPDDQSVTVLKEVAKLSVKSHYQQTSALTLKSYRQEIKPNDVLLPAPALGATADLHFSPSMPPEPVSATIVGSVNGQQYMATKDVVVVDKGHLDKLQAGHILHLYQPSIEVGGKKGEYRYSLNKGSEKDFRLAPRAVGEAMVIRAYDAYSFAVVLSSSEPFTKGVMVVSPQMTQ
ncbi:hypothetical protein A3K86_17085 [Photobacterium jeanii]|uniref:LysM domain-containing protein n=2 Tax=Photobacterium jeanii TaxID=858640 RepID=A0A178K7B3_9GAMM|nr:LysM peptidoglycan-binding domain-containing protein [Photobacterium jeanii]OAN12624.1 hypothetical protein A3K86_17085 [Photobacterium jeanii]